MSVVHALCHEVFEEGALLGELLWSSVALKERRFHCRRVREAGGTSERSLPTQTN
ncbi:Hypothetical protein FKW44_018976 [Caligus rogercresseyi]|uniref:Uncharacterized protein n=1 Tax=Caligus rogercresseyi TaxID=217165 RepID=A0A7T8JYF6_CALRO|nr:Hypothetical protein FKW44_018976 [Caligus rogercresseyi]